MTAAHPEHTPDIAGFVLAGGQSSRMGTNKALLPFQGQPLVVRALNLLRDAGINPAIAGGDAALVEFAPLIPDPDPDPTGHESQQGPLAGICAALASTSARFALFLPVDSPLIPASLLLYMAEHALITGSRVTLCSVNGYAQTFPAVVDRTMLHRLEESLHSGERGCFAAFQKAADHPGRQLSVLPVEILAQTGRALHPGGLPPAQWFLNANSPPDLAHAQRLLGRFPVS